MDMIVWAILVVQVALDIVGLAILAVLVVMAIISAAARLAVLADGVMMWLAGKLIELDGVDQNFAFWLIGVVLGAKLNTLGVLAAIFILYFYVYMVKRRRRVYMVKRRRRRNAG